jgi:hypothetical protein
LANSPFELQGDAGYREKRRQIASAAASSHVCKGMIRFLYVVLDLSNAVNEEDMRQGLPLLHISPQPEPFSVTKIYSNHPRCPSKSAHVRPKRGRV